MTEREAFPMKLKQQCHLSQQEKWLYCAQSRKESILLCESIFVLIDKWTLTLKNDGKRSFSYETKASMSFIPIRRMCLWHPIMKRKEITMLTHVCPNWQMSFGSKK